jgi:muramidase (phage lysozyme)
MTWRFHFFQKRPEHRDKFVDRYLDSLELTDSELRRRFRAHIDRVSGFWAGMQGPTRTVEA